MKRFLLLSFACILLLCACNTGRDLPLESTEDINSTSTESSEGALIETDQESSIAESSESSVEESNESSVAESSDSSDDEISYPPYPEYSAPTEDIEAVPILFLDTSDHRHNQAYIICAVNENGLYTTQEFRYNDKHLLEHMHEQGVQVETNIIDTAQTFEFFDKNGEVFSTSCGEVQCYGEEILDEVHVCTKVQADIPTDSRRFLGTYSGVDIFPEALEYGDNSVIVDLDCDGDNEIIRWSFKKDEEYTSWDNYYYYTLEAVIDGKTVYISDNYDWVPTKRRDLEIFIADIDMDGNYEVIEYVKAASRFNNIYIYNVSSDKSERLLFYTISPEP